MAREDSAETVMALAVSKSRSLRTTVPIHVARQLGLEPGSRVKWDMDKVRGRWIATICKAGERA